VLRENNISNWTGLRFKSSLCPLSAVKLKLVRATCGKSTIMDKCLGGLLHPWGFFQFTQAQPLPPSHATNIVGRVYPEFFPSFNKVLSRERKNCKEILKRIDCLMRASRNYRKLRTLPHCPKDFCPGL